MPYNDAIKLLAKRDYSRFKLVQKLKQKGHSKEAIDETIEELLEKKYLREDLYIEARIKGLIRKGYAADFIKKKLAAENCSIETDQVYKQMEELKIDERSIVFDLIEKKLYGKELSESRDKVMRFLLSKGYSYPLIKECFQDISE